MRKHSGSNSLMSMVIMVCCFTVGAAAALARQEQGATPPEEAKKDEPAAVVAATPNAPSEGSARPPRTGKMVGDHWTPYEPPAAESFPQGSTLHVIVAGDTLWDLSTRYLENPYLWPQIWEVNQYVTDSHWIYPGDPLLIPGKPTVIGENGPATPEPAIEMLEPPSGPGAMQEPGSVAEPPTSVRLAPVGPVLAPVADASDVYCSNYIVHDFEKPALQVREREDASRTILGTGDIVFLNQGMSAGLNAGDEFTAVINEGSVLHPITGAVVGDSIRQVGRVKVVALQKSTATAQIVQACDGIEVGTMLLPYEEIPVPLATPAEFQRYGVQISGENTGYIVDVTPEKWNIGKGDIVNIDLGSEAGLQPGDVLTIFRDWGGSIEFASTESYIEGQQARAERVIEEGAVEAGENAQAILGQLVVLRTQDRTATAKVVLSVREMSLGDRVAPN